MRPRPRARSVVKWGGAIVTVLVLAAWVASARWYLGWTSADASTTAYVAGGGIGYVQSTRYRVPRPRTGWQVRRHQSVWTNLPTQTTTRRAFPGEQSLYA